MHAGQREVRLACIEVFLYRPFPTFSWGFVLPKEDSNIEEYQSEESEPLTTTNDDPC
jgi:hypothetical protein